MGADGALEVNASLVRDLPHINLAARIPSAAFWAIGTIKRGHAKMHGVAFTE